MVPNTKNKADKNANVKGRGYLEQNRTTSLTDKHEHHYLTKSEIDKRDANYSNTILRKEHNNTLNEVEVDNRLNGIALANTTQPKPYEPNEWEKGILDHLELSTIVIENDPCDPNRYFKKTDPVDWYRVIMKGKKPCDSNSLINTTDETRRHSRKTKCRNSSIENETETKKRRKKRRQNRSQSDLGFGGSSMKSEIFKQAKKTKDRHLSSDSYDKAASECEHTINASRNTSQPRLVTRKPTTTQNTKRSSALSTSQPLQASNKPMKVQEPMCNEYQKTDEPKYMASNSEHVPESYPEHVPTRKITSKSSTANIPSTEPRNKPKGINRQISCQSENESYFNREISTSSSSNSSFSDKILERNTPLRYSQPRSNLFNTSSKLNSQHMSTDKAGEGKLAVKRPAIVPPLNLTGTSDNVGRNDDGIEEFLLN